MRQCPSAQSVRWPRKEFEVVSSDQKGGRGGGGDACGTNLCDGTGGRQGYRLLPPRLLRPHLRHERSHALTNAVSQNKLLAELDIRASLSWRPGVQTRATKSSKTKIVRTCVRNVVRGVLGQVTGIATRRSGDSPRHGSFLTRNSSRETHPPPTRTMTVDRRMRTRRSFCDSPNRYLPSPTWKTL